MYMNMGPVIMSLSILQDALAAAMICCNDAIEKSLADLPTLKNDLLGNALKFLADVSSMYRKLESKRVTIPVIREVLEKAMV